MQTEAEEAKPQVEPKQKSNVSNSKSSIDKFAKARIAAKHRKKKAHRRKIARSNTNG